MDKSKKDNKAGEANMKWLFLLQLLELHLFELVVERIIHIIEIHQFLCIIFFILFYFYHLAYYVYFYHSTYYYMQFS